jgi:hypothetical protein
MAISLGPKLGLLFNANINEAYYDAFRPFLQAIDALVQANVINASTVVPPVSPSNGDAYLLIATPSGAWSGHQYAIAVWDTQVTNSGTNTTNPQWVFYEPNPGWIVWNVATTSFLGWTGSSWSNAPFGGGANFPVNTDITSMTGLTNVPTLGDPTTPFSIVNAGAPTQTCVFTFVGSTSGGVQTVWADTNHSTTVSGAGIGTGGITCSGEITTGSLNVASGITSNLYSNATPGQSSIFSNNGGAQDTLIIGGGGTGSLLGLLGFQNYFTQTTIGAAGGASALPATPLGYLNVDYNGTIVAIPFYHRV